MPRAVPGVEEMNSIRTQVRQHRLLVCSLTWLISGVLLFVALRHNLVVYLVTAFAWVLAGAARLLWRRLRWWTVLAAPVLSIAAWLLLARGYTAFYWHQQDRALDEFIDSVASGQPRAQFTLETSDVSQVLSDFSVDYTVLGEDELFGTVYRTVRFENGSRYHTAVTQVSPGRWRIVVRHVPITKQ